MDSSQTAWIVVGALVAGVGAGVVLSPRFARVALSLSYHEKMASRFPRLYGALGWSWLIRHPKSMRMFTVLVGLAVAGVGIAVVLVSLAR